MMRLFGRKKMDKLQDSLKTITEESVLLLKVGPLTEDHPPTTQPIIPTPKKGGFWAIRQLLKKKKGRYNVTLPLITNEEENVLLSVNPITEDHPPTTQPIIPTPKKGGFWAIRQLLKKKKGRYNVTLPLITNEEENVLLSVNPIIEDRPPEDTTPPRGEGRENGRGGEEAEHGLQPIPQPKFTKDEVIEANNDSTTIDTEDEKSMKRTWKDFTIHNILGEGGFGKVMLASHPSIRQKVAIKMIKLRGCESADDNIEYNLLERCKNQPYITRLFTTFQIEDELFFVMEFLNGGTLFELIHISAPFEDSIIRCLTAEIICGLQFIHARGIVHRDIKPMNILLHGNGHIRISDFGLSAAGVTKKVRIKGCVGTPNYMAPEILKGQPYNTTVDYYSLGVIVNEMSVNMHELRQMEIQGTAPDFPENRIRPKDRDVHLKDLIDMLLCEDQYERARLVRNIRRHPFFKTTDWAKVKKGKSPAAFTPQPIFKQRKDLNMKIEEFIAEAEEDLESTIEDTEN